MSGTIKFIATIIIVVALAGTFLGFTKPGHQLLFKIGFTSACDGSCN